MFLRYKDVEKYELYVRIYVYNMVIRIMYNMGIAMAALHCESIKMREFICVFRDTRIPTIPFE